MRITFGTPDGTAFMAIEIERKFLVLHDGWRHDAGPGRRVCQGYISRSAGTTVRIRRIGDQAFLTVKGARNGISRPEYEYEIPLADAEAMLADLCLHPPLEKVRYDVPHAGLVWEVDVFEGSHAGLVLAEVELDHADQPIALPAWVGPEVTYDVRYRSAALARSGGLPRLSGRPAAPAAALALPTA
jgi:CYTH domain-containing protein